MRCRICSCLGSKKQGKNREEGFRISNSLLWFAMISSKFCQSAAGKCSNSISKCRNVQEATSTVCDLHWPAVEWSFLVALFTGISLLFFACLITLAVIYEATGIDSSLIVGNDLLWDESQGQLKSLTLAQSTIRLANLGPRNRVAFACQNRALSIVQVLDGNHLQTSPEQGSISLEQLRLQKLCFFKRLRSQSALLESDDADTPSENVSTRGLRRAPRTEQLKIRLEWIGLRHVWRHWSN